MGQVLNTASYYKRKNILEALTAGKSKVKVILKEQSDSINADDNQFLFGEHFENEFSKNLNVKQKSKSVFTVLKTMTTTSSNR